MGGASFGRISDNLKDSPITEWRASGVRVWIGQQSLCLPADASLAGALRARQPGGLRHGRARLRAHETGRPGRGGRRRRRGGRATRGTEGRATRERGVREAVWSECASCASGAASLRGYLSPAVGTQGRAVRGRFPRCAPLCPLGSRQHERAARHEEIARRLAGHRSARRSGRRGNVGPVPGQQAVLGGGKGGRERVPGTSTSRWKKG